MMPRGCVVVALAFTMVGLVSCGGDEEPVRSAAKSPVSTTTTEPTATPNSTTTTTVPPSISSELAATDVGVCRLLQEAVDKGSYTGRLLWARIVPAVSGSQGPLLTAGILPADPGASIPVFRKAVAELIPYYSAVVKQRTDLSGDAVVVASGTSYDLSNKDVVYLPTADLRSFDGGTPDEALRIANTVRADSDVVTSLMDPRFGPDERILTGQFGDIPEDPCIDLSALPTTTTTAPPPPYSYVVEGSGSATVTYTGIGLSTQQEDVTLPWRKDFPFSFGVGSILVQIHGAGSVTCRILSDGDQVAEATSSGQYVIVSCQH